MTLTLILASALLLACVLDGIFGSFAGGRSVPAHQDRKRRPGGSIATRSRHASKGDET